MQTALAGLDGVSGVTFHPPDQFQVRVEPGLDDQRWRRQARRAVGDTVVARGTRQLLSRVKDWLSARASR